MRTPLKPDNIPVPLRDARQWVVFKVLDDRKVPLSHTGGEAKANDETTWSSLPEVLAAIEYEVGQYPALALSEDYKLRFFDLDHCFTEDGSLTPLAAQIVAAAPNTYIERSASGNGLHVLAWMSGEKMPSNRVCDGLEVYGTTPRFCIFTGDLYPGSALDINEEPQTLVQLVQSLAGITTLAPTPAGAPRVIPSKNQAAAKKRWFRKMHPMVPAGERNNTLFKYAALLQNLGYTPVDIAEELWVFNTAACRPPFNRLNTTDAAEVDGIVRSAVTNVPPGVPASTHTAAVGVAPVPEPVDPVVAAKAQEIYQSGRFVEYCHEVWRKIWVGDEYILDLVLLAAACLSVTNATDGINIHVAGSTQSGKSAAAKTALKFVHPKNKFTGTFSKMGLFSGHFHEKMLIFSDDTQFGDEQAGVLRGALTNWRSGSNRITMLDKKWIDATIPPRVNLVLTSVDSVTTVTHDGQDESRFLTVEIRRSPETLAAIQKAMQREPPDVSRELQIVHAVWENVGETPVAFHRDLMTDGAVPLREWARYLDLIRARALLFGRSTTTDDDVANMDYLMGLTRRMLAADRAGLTKNEALVLNIITRNPLGISVSDIHTQLGRLGHRTTIQTVRNNIRGCGGTWENATGGLLAKEVGVSCRYDHTTHQYIVCMIGDSSTPGICPTNNPV